MEAGRRRSYLAICNMNKKQKTVSTQMPRTVLAVVHAAQLAHLIPLQLK